MVSRATIALAALAACVISCSTDQGDNAGPAATQAAAAASAPDSERRSIGVACAMDDAVTAERREPLVESARALLSALREGRHDTLWQALHPQAQRPEDRRAFLDTLATLQARLDADPGSTPAVETIAIAEVEGGVNDVARVVCRSPDATEGPPALTVLVNAGDEPVGYVSLLVPGPVFEHAAVFQLRERAGWHLLGVQVSPSRFRGKSATDWVTLAGELRRSGKLVPAYAALAMAGAMAARGPTVTTPLSTAIDTDLQTLRDSDPFVAQTGRWIVDGEEFDLHGLTLAATQRDVSLVVKYGSDRGLVEDLVGRDADKLMDHVRTQYPELREIVDAVVFEAYARAPSPGQAVEAFRVVRLF